MSNKYEFKGSSAPWSKEIQKNGDIKIIGNHGHNIAISKYFPLTNSTDIANTDLIAAAPLLLQACIKVLSSLNKADDVKGYWDEEQKILQASIHKALNINE